MSAPRTPAEMADWLEEHSKRLKVQAHGDIVRDVADWIRQQPTDAQKIEALKAASDAGEMGITGVRFWTQKGQPFRAHAHEAGACARKALRLLGLPTE